MNTCCFHRRFITRLLRLTSLLPVYLVAVQGLAQTPQVRPDSLNEAPTTSNLPSPVQVPTQKAQSNPWDRLAIVSDYNQNFLGSAVTNTQLAWTGSVTACLPGDISALSQTRTLQRINYYRRLVGLSDNTTFDATRNPETQAAALMMLANNSLSHTPPASWLCYTTAGYTGADKSNIALGSHSSAAVTQFINDYGGSNQPVGHRRWLLYSRAASFGHGSALSGNGASDIIWVFNPFSTPASLPPFVAFPPAGYVPRTIIPYRWSFSIPAADFSGASVSVTDDGGAAVSVNTYVSTNGYGDNTLVWDLANPTSALAWNGSTDKSFVVNISGVRLNSVLQPPYNYTVVAIDPTAVCPGPTPVASCTPTVTGGQSLYYGTESVSFNGIDLVSSSAQNDGGNYNNLTCSTQTTVTAGNTYTLSVKGYFTNSHILRAWIDYNGNGQFTDTGELVLTGSANSQTTAVTIPLSATTNTLVRMRILADGFGGTISPCQINGGGQIDDVAVWIQAPNCQIATATITGSQTITTGQTASLTATFTGDSPRSLTLSNGQTFNNITTSPFAFTVAPTATTTYSVVAVSNGCGAGTASGSAVVTVPVVATCAGAVTAPETDMTLNSIRLNWQGVPGVTNYTLQYRETGTTNWTTVTVAASATSLVISATFGKTYEWQIRVNCPNGQPSAFSPLRTFTMSCPAPTGLYEYHIGPQSAGLAWTLLTGIDYTLQIRPRPTSTWTSYPASQATSGYYMTNLVNDTVYDWQIIATCPNGTTSISTTRSFTTQCAVPTARSTNSITTSGAILAWVFDASVQYTLRYQAIGSGVWVENFVRTSPYSLTGLTANTTYEWQVQMVCNGVGTAYSSSLTFTTGCNAPSYNYNAPQNLDR